jgi:hypothetical protein
MSELRSLFTPRDIPLLFVVLPQAYTVALWQWEGRVGATPLTGEAWSVAAWVALVFAVLGGIGYEAIYVGAVAWARRINDNRAAHAWAFLTAVASLGFSVGVAVYVYRAQGGAAWLHAGFPVVAFLYTVMTFAAHTHAAEPAHAPRPTEDTAPPALDAAQLREDPAQLREDPAQLVARLRDAGEGEREIVGALRQGYADISNYQIARLVGRAESTVRGWP